MTKKVRSEPGANAYPRREPFHANSITRAIFQSEAAAKLSPRALLLIIHIAQLEDDMRYRGPVLCWNANLANSLGMRSPKQLNEARREAVEAGWLVYERAHDRAQGTYFTTHPVPECVPKTESKNGQSQGNSTQKHSENGKQTENGTQNTKQHAAPAKGSVPKTESIEHQNTENTAQKHSENGKQTENGTHQPKNDLNRAMLSDSCSDSCSVSCSENGKPPILSPIPYYLGLIDRLIEGLKSFDLGKMASIRLDAESLSVDRQMAMTALAIATVANEVLNEVLEEQDRDPQYVRNLVKAVAKADRPPRYLRTSIDNLLKKFGDDADGNPLVDWATTAAAIPIEAFQEPAANQAKPTKLPQVYSSLWFEAWLQNCPPSSDDQVNRARACFHDKISTITSIRGGAERQSLDWLMNITPTMPIDEWLQSSELIEMAKQPHHLRVVGAS